MSTLVVAEHDNQELGGATGSVIAAALKLDQKVDVAVIGHNCSAVADQTAALEGVDRVLVCDSESQANFVAEEVAAQVQALVQANGYTHILAAATTAGKNFLPRLAALLDVQPLSEIIAVLSSTEYQRPIYAGNCIATVVSDQPVQCMTVRTTAFDSVTASASAASIEPVEAVGAVSLTTFVSEELVKSERPELTAADIVISGGRGMGSGENFAIIEKVADKLGAAVGASRAAVDSGFVSNDLQVGQTGKIVAPTLYIAVGISGAIQHLAGMKDSKVIVAINKDAEAPIFQVADYGLVADLFQAVPELEQAL